MHWAADKQNAQLSELFIEQLQSSLVFILDVNILCFQVNSSYGFS